MASEQIETSVPVETTTAAGESAQPAAATEQQTKDGKPKRVRTPPEELFDLTKPIPRVDKPNKEDFEKEVNGFGDAIEALKKKKETIQTQIEATINGSRNSSFGTELTALKQLKQKKNKLIDEKKAMRARLDAVRKATDNLMNDRKAARANVRFTDAKSIDDEIKKLRNRQETTSMSLAEEKRLIKEIDALQASKQLIADLSDKDAGIDNAKEQKKVIAGDLKAKDAEIDAVQVEIDKQKKVVDGLGDSNKKSNDELKNLKKEREDLKKEIGDKIGERNKCRDAFREANDKFYDYQRAIKAQRKMKYEEEKKQREEEKAAYLAAKEAEEAKKIPYEEEMNLCEYLADYLSKTYLEDKKKGENGSKKDDVIAVKDDPFAGFVPLKKNDDEVFLKMGAGKKPRSRASKKKAPPAFKLNVDSFEQFGLLGLTPPTSLEAVQQSVDDLKAKKEWYSKQERGSVPTAKDVRKANEKAAQKLRQGESTAAPKKNGKLDISSDDFAPLSAGGSTATMNAMWGQKAPEAVPEEASADAAPEETTA